MSNSPEETVAIGFRLGKILKPGNVVGLYGELGSGKTTMVKGIASAVGISERDIVSASFTIIAEYNTDPPFTHIDLYRINTSSELIELGIWEHLDSKNITVIEWAEKCEQWLPEQVMKVRLQTMSNTGRTITIEGIHEEDRDNL
jgi:tRNA threonylcarbamoyladenosine biosynthesis protein TsaE